MTIRLAFFVACVLAPTATAAADSDATVAGEIRDRVTASDADFLYERGGAWVYGLTELPKVVASMSEFFSSIWYVISFGAIDGQWYARRADGGMDRETTIRWANEGQCPTLRPSLEALESLPTHPINLHDIGRPLDRDQIDILLDGATFRLFARNEPIKGRTFDTIVLTSNYGTPLAEWFEKTGAALEGCWAIQPPDWAN